MLKRIKIITRDKSGAVAVEMAVSFVLLTLALLGVTELGIAQIQQKHADHAFGVFSELLTSHRGDVTCDDVKEYYDLALDVFVAGNLGGYDPKGRFSKRRRGTKDEPFRLRVAGVKVERNANNKLEQSVVWQALRDFNKAYKLGPSDILPKELEIEGQFYLVVEGRTHLYPTFNLLSGGKNKPLVRDIEKHIFIPRYQASMDMKGRTKNWCKYLS